MVDCEAERREDRCGVCRCIEVWRGSSFCFLLSILIANSLIAKE